MEIMKVESPITEIKILQEGLNSRFHLAEERISELKERSIEIIQFNNWESKWRKMNSLREIGDMFVWWE